MCKLPQKMPRVSSLENPPSRIRGRTPVKSSQPASRNVGLAGYDSATLEPENFAQQESALIEAKSTSMPRSAVESLNRDLDAEAQRHFSSTNQVCHPPAARVRNLRSSRDKLATRVLDKGGSRPYPRSQCSKSSTWRSEGFGEAIAMGPGSRCSERQC